MKEYNDESKKFRLQPTAYSYKFVKTLNTKVLREQVYEVLKLCLEQNDYAELDFCNFIVNSLYCS